MRTAADRTFAPRPTLAAARRIKAPRTRRPVAGTGTTARVDTRLIAAVQGAAGAMTHQAARLSQTYCLWADVHRRAADRGDGDAAAEARREVRAAEVCLRRFLTGSSPGRT